MPNSSSGWYKATILRRYFAVFIDGVIIGIASFIIALFVPKDSSLSSLMQLLTTLVGWIYAVFFIWQSGATPGKMAMGIKVVRADGSKLSLWQAFLREVIGKSISGLVFMLGYLWILWDKNRQAWHDHIAGTYVVTKIPNDGKNPGCLIMLIISVVVFVPIVATLAAIVVLIINPLEIVRTSRDTQRLNDVIAMQNALFEVKSMNPELSLCKGDSRCTTSSALKNTASNGSGWIPVDLSTTNLTVLPVDPVNSVTQVYTYCSDGENWEIEMPLESEKMKKRMPEDNGDKDMMYEVGSDMTLCK